MFDLLKQIFLGKKEIPAEPSKLMPDVVKEAARRLPAHIKKLDPLDLEKIIARQNKPNKWLITRICASGRLQKQPCIGGLGYKHDDNSPQMMEKRGRQLEKGMIQDNSAEIERRWQLRQERLKKQEAKKQEVSDGAGQSEVVQ